MPGKRKSNLSQSSKKAKAMKIIRSRETSPQAELRRIEQAWRQAARRAAETPEQADHRRQQHARYMASQRAAKMREQSRCRRLNLVNCKFPLSWKREQGVEWIIAEEMNM